MNRTVALDRHAEVTAELQSDVLELAAVRSAVIQRRAELFTSLNGTGAYAITAVREMVSADVAVSEASIIELQGSIDAHRAELNHLEWCLREAD